MKIKVPKMLLGKHSLATQHERTTCRHTATEVTLKKDMQELIAVISKVGKTSYFSLMKYTVLWVLVVQAQVAMTWQILIKPVLETGKVKIIGATTWDEYQQAH